MARALGLIAALVLAGCGSLNGPTTGKVSPPTDALARWSDFPADQVPRPIVLLGTEAPGQAYDTNDAKIAGLCGKFALSAQMPSEVPKQATATWPDGTASSYSAISAADAFSRIQGGPGASNPACQAVPALTVTSARFDVAGFATDRGTAQMSAWRFRATGASAEFNYPAVATSAFWRTGTTPVSIGGGATLGSGGRTLTISFVGGPAEGTCAEDYSAVVAESTHAVAVAIQSFPGRSQAGPVACDAVGYLRNVTVALTSPVGGRVVVDASGGAMAVCPEGTRAGC